MNPIEEQILKNQLRIMNKLLYTNSPVSDNKLILVRNETERLLLPNKDKEDCCDMSEKDAFEEKSE